MCVHAVTCLTIFVGIVQATMSFGSATDPNASSVQVCIPAVHSLVDRGSAQHRPRPVVCGSRAIVAACPNQQGVLMVVMNLGVVALPVIELRNFVLDPLRALLRFVGVLRADMTKALDNKPASTPADTEPAPREVPPLYHALGTVCWHVK